MGSSEIAGRGSRSSGRGRAVFLICTTQLCFFAVLSWSAIETKNATIDEPQHVLSGWLALRDADFRLAPENPSMWQCYAALPNTSQDLNIRFDSRIFNPRSFDSQDGINWTSRTLYRTPGNDGEAFVRRSRMMMLPLGVALGGLIGWWAFELAGPAAAVVATLLVSFDPNFLAHSPVVKGDVPLALLMLMLAYLVWQIGTRASVARMIAVGFICGLAVNTKFSGLLFFPMLGFLLLIRAVLPMPWDFLDRSLSTVRGRLLVAPIVLLVSLVLSYFITWTAYSFRFRPAPASDSQMDMPGIRRRAVLLEAAAAAKTHDPTPQEIQRWNPSVLVRGIDFANQHRLLPQAMLAGLLYQHACTQLWPSYLLGRLYGTGRWYYFPLAVLFKTPLATLVMFGAAGILGLVLMVRKRSIHFASQNSLWNVACFAVPFGVYALVAMQSNLDIGLRHVLPLYPFLFIATGVMAQRSLELCRRWTSVATAFLAMALIAETLRAWPDFIPFFNLAAGGSRGGFALLGDSNLDWGQDLKALRTWQRQHPAVPVYLHYFGMVDPDFFQPLSHPFQLAPDGASLVCDVPMQPGVLAISTNYLQGLYDGPGDLIFFRKLGLRPPDQIIGGSIYLYHYPLR